MNAVPFDTLRVARRLEGAGVPAAQAAETAEALGEAMAEVATKSDLKGLGNELRYELRELELRMTVKMGGMLVAAVGVMLAAMRFLALPIRP